MNVVVSCPAVSASDHWLTDVMHRVTFNLEKRGINASALGVNISFKRLRQKGNNNIVRVGWDVAERLRQSKVLRSIRDSIADLDRKVEFFRLKT